MIDFDKLKQFAKTDKEIEVLDLAKEGKNTKEISAETGYPERTVRDIKKRVKDRASIKGYAPESNLDVVLPDTQMIKGTSALYRKSGLNGEPILQWVKTREDPEFTKKIQEAFVDAIMDDIPPMQSKPFPSTINFNKDVIPWIQIGDAHIGMLAHKDEVGENFDLKIAERELTRAIFTLIDRCMNCERCVINDLGDATHYETFKALTEASGHAVDYDTRYFKMIKVYVRIMRNIIEKALSKFKYVDVIINQGNHSRSNDIFMAAFLNELYRDEERLTVLENSSVFIPYRMGNTFVMTVHGDKAKREKAADVMATDFAKDWGESTFRYIDMGHVHSKTITAEKAGVIVESFNQMAGQDKYAHDYGWRSRKFLTLVYRSKTYGEIGRLHITREEVQDLIEYGESNGKSVKPVRDVYTV